jgi:hypothetical protein
VKAVEFQGTYFIMRAAGDCLLVDTGCVAASSPQHSGRYVAVHGATTVYGQHCFDAPSGHLVPSVLPGCCNLIWFSMNALVAA